MITASKPAEASTAGHATRQPYEALSSSFEHLDHTCMPTATTLKIAFFFGGTGNNLEADESTDKHSNVERLFKAHPGKLSRKASIRTTSLTGAGRVHQFRLFR